MQGQIQPSSKFGQFIHNICKRDSVINIVEIGTWNGAGSTKCVYEAIKNTNKNFITLEVDEDMYGQALSQYPQKSNINLILGKITDSTVDLDSYGDEFFTDYPRSVKHEWLERDVSNMQRVPNVLEVLPPKIDFLILDGGEFTSLIEYMLLKDRSRIIAADDTRIPCIKNYSVRKEMMKERVILLDDQISRNGFTICENE